MLESPYKNTGFGKITFVGKVCMSKNIRNFNDFGAVQRIQVSKRNELY